MSTTVYDHRNVDSQSPFFHKIGAYRPSRTAILVSNVPRGRVSGLIAVGEEGPFLAQRKANLILIPRLGSLRKMTVRKSRCSLAWEQALRGALAAGRE